MTSIKNGPSKNGRVADFDFGHLHVDEKTCEYPLDSISPGFGLVMRPANDSVNVDYRDAVMAMTSHRNRMRSSKITDDDIRLSRDEDIETFPGNVIVGFVGEVRDRSGVVVEFSIDNCRSLLRAMPPWLLDRVRLHPKLMESFVDRVDSLPTSDQKKVGGLVKN